MWCWRWVESKIKSVFAVAPVPEPSVQIRTRPESSVSTPCGFAGNEIKAVTAP